MVRAELAQLAPAQLPIVSLLSAHLNVLESARHCAGSSAQSFSAHGPRRCFRRLILSASTTGVALSMSRSKFAKDTDLGLCCFAVCPACLQKARFQR